MGTDLSGPTDTAMDEHQTKALLDRITGGDEDAAAALLPVVYERLRGLADHYLRPQPGHGTLQPTALVHEAYLKMVDRTGIDPRSQTHFVAIAAQAMRWIVADHARRRLADKRGGGWERVTLDRADRFDEHADLDLISLHEALDELAKKDPRAAKIVELRFFGGLTTAQIAAHLDLSPSMIKHEWRWIRAWLLNALTPGDAS